MAYYFIVCRSLTYAQRTSKVLERGGIPNYLARTPKHIVREGCGHGVKLGEKYLEKALEVLEKSNLPPKQLYFSSGGSDFKEVPL